MKGAPSIAAELSVTERILLFGLASGTEWRRGSGCAGYPPNGSGRPIAVIYMAAAFFRLLPIAVSCSSGLRPTSKVRASICQ
jgi:hypothetical protein